MREKITLLLIKDGSGISVCKVYDRASGETLADEQRDQGRLCAVIEVEPEFTPSDIVSAR